MKNLKSNKVVQWCLIAGPVLFAAWNTYKEQKDSIEQEQEMENLKNRIKKLEKGE